MRWRARKWLAGACVALGLALGFAAPAHAVPARAAPRLALLIANTTYPDAGTPRTAAEDDAGDLETALGAAGFDVAHETNLGKRAMRAALDAFLAKITPGATALLYFNGFGLQVRHQTFLLPTDVEIWTEADVAKEGVAVAGLLSDMQKRGAKVKIAIIDAARANPFERRVRSKPLGLAPLALPPNTLAIFNAGVGALGVDDAPFMEDLVAAIDTPDLGATQAFNQARLAVAKDTDKKQAPWVASTLAARFVFAASGGRKFCTSRYTGRFMHWGACEGGAYYGYYRPYYHRRSWTGDEDEPATPSGGPPQSSAATQSPAQSQAPEQPPPPPPPVAPPPTTADATPKFPWPPPAPSTSYQLPNSLFGKDPTMGGVAETITRALDNAGYAERRYYALPVAGLALATRLERFNADGSPGAPRWQTKQERSLFDLLRGLFFTDPGHYRVIVFLITKEPPGRSQADVPIDEAKGWLRGGLDVVPKDAGAAPYGDGTTLAYIYDFVSTGQTFTLDREPLPGKDQLTRAGVLTALGATKP